MVTSERLSFMHTDKQRTSTSTPMFYAICFTDCSSYYQRPMCCTKNAICSCNYMMIELCCHVSLLWECHKALFCACLGTQLSYAKLHCTTIWKRELPWMLCPFFVSNYLLFHDMKCNFTCPTSYRQVSLSVGGSVVSGYQWPAESFLEQELVVLSAGLHQCSSEMIIKEVR